MTCHVDGTRKRRKTNDLAKRQWYARYRSRRYARRIWGEACTKWADRMLGR